MSTENIPTITTSTHTDIAANDKRLHKLKSDCVIKESKKKTNLPRISTQLAEMSNRQTVENIEGNTKTGVQS